MREQPLNDNSDEQTRQELVTIAEAWGKAIVSNDADAIAGFTADDWVIVSETGISEKEQFLSFVASGDLTHDSMNMVEGTDRIRIYGDTAILTGRVTNTANYKGQAFEADEWTTDVFQKIDGIWKCVLSHITAAKK